MRKLLMATALCCMTMMSVSLTACGGDDEPNVPVEPAKDTTPAFVLMKFTYEATQDMLDYCNVVVKYNDGTGEKNETMTTTSWSKTVKAALPATLSFDREVTLKADKDITAVEKFTYCNSYSNPYEIVNKSGESLSKGGSSTGTSSSFSGAQVEQLITAGRLNLSHTYTFDKNGNKSE